MFPTQEIMDEKPDGSLVVSFKVGRFEEVRDLIKIWLPHVKILKPDVLIESDSHSEMPANDFVKEYGGKVVVIPYFKNQSSTTIKNQIKKHA